MAMQRENGVTVISAGGSIGGGRELSFTVLCGGSVGAQGCNGYGPGAEVRG